MKIIDLPRGAGKSRLIVRWVSRDVTNRVVVCCNYEMTRYLLEMAEFHYPKSGFSQGNFIGVGDLSSLRGRNRDLQVGIDDLESVLW